MVVEQGGPAAVSVAGPLPPRGQWKTSDGRESCLQVGTVYRRRGIGLALAVIIACLFGLH